MLKKLLCGIAAIIIFSSTVFAEDIIFREIEHVTVPSSAFMDGFVAEYEEADIGNPDDVVLFSDPDMPIEEFLREQMMLRAVEVNVKAYNLSLYEFSKIYFNTIFSDCMLPVEPRFRYSMENDVVAYIQIRYIFDSEEEDFDAYRKLNLLVNEICNYAAVGKTDLEKALFAYQKIVYECDYDPFPVTDENGNDVYDVISHTAYGFSENGYAVCQGYSLLYREVLRRLGIQSTVVTCQTGIDHMWNYVNLDGNWYHTDVTNGKLYYRFADGSVQIAYGYNDMKYFLRSDSIENHGSKLYWEVYDMDFVPECYSTEYESGYMFNNNQAIIYRANDMLSFEIYSILNHKISVVPFSARSLKESVFFSDIINKNNNTYNRYMYSLEEVVNPNIIYAKYKNNKMTGCSLIRNNIMSNTLYLMQQNVSVPVSENSNKFMVWDSGMSIPLAKCAVAKTEG